MKMGKYLLTTSFLICIAVYVNAQIIPTDYIAYYPFNGNANDESGNGNNGTVNGATLSSDRFVNTDNAYSFDGTDDEISLGDILDADISGVDKKFAFSFWIYSSSLSTNTTKQFLSKYGNSNCGISQRQYFIRLRDGVLQFLWYGALNASSYRGVTGSTLVELDKWNHVCIVYDGSIDSGNGLGRVSIFLNNEIEGTILSQTKGTAISQIPNGSAHLGIGNALDNNGNNCGSYYHQSFVDDIRIYNRTLTISEISALYNEADPNGGGGGGTSLWTASGPNNIYYDSGNVGIGTTNPLSLLSVDGLIRAEEIKVVANVDVPDYVFEPDYPLRSLDDLRSYIHDQGHLPDMPSAAEIQLANGFKLGDMDMRLLRKIEELTLYTIEQEEALRKTQTALRNQEKMNTYLLTAYGEQRKAINEHQMALNELLIRIEKLGKRN